MTTVSMVACIVVAWSILQMRFGSVVTAWLERFRPAPRTALACCVALVPVFAAQIVLLWLQVRYEDVAPAEWMRRLPLPVYDRHGLAPALHQTFAAAGFALGALEAALLALAAFGFQNSKALPARAVAGVAVVMALLAVASPVMGTTDPYEYAAAGMLGFTAYAPPPGVFDRTVYGPIYPHIPMNGVLYGPLWLLFDTVTTFFAPTILLKLLVMRIVNALLVAAFIALLARAQVSRVALAVCAANPVVWYYFVLNPHADIECLVLTAVAFLCSKHARGIAAMLLIVAASIIKIPFIVAGAAALAPIRSAWQRLALWAGAVALTLGISYLIPGPVYLHTVARATNEYAARARIGGAETYISIIPFVCVLMVIYVAFRWSAPGLAWTFAQLSPFAAAWYLFWGLPYALATETLTLFLVPLPLLTAMRDFNFVGSPIPLYIVSATFGVFLLDAYLVGRRRLAGLARAP